MLETVLLSVFVVCWLFCQICWFMEIRRRVKYQQLWEGVCSMVGKPSEDDAAVFSLLYKMKTNRYFSVDRFAQQQERLDAANRKVKNLRKALREFMTSQVAYVNESVAYLEEERKRLGL